MNTIDLGASTVSGNLSVTAAGPIMQSGAITANVVGKTATFAAGAGNNITLAGANDFSTVMITNGYDVTLNDINGIDLGNSAIAGNLNVTAAGPITESGYITANGVGKTATFAAGAGNNITLGENNDFSTLTVASGNNVSVNDVTAINLGVSTVSGTLNVTACGTITQTGPLSVTGAATFAAGSTNDIILADSNNFSSVGITNANDVILNSTGALALNNSTVSNNLTAIASGDLTLNGLINAGSIVTINSTGGAIINGMGSSISISANMLDAIAVNGIGSGDPLMTGVCIINAVNTTANNIEIDNTGVLAVGGLSNGGTGNVILQNIGEITTDGSTITSGGAVSIIANSPLTIGAGGVSANGNITLEASASGASDDLTINGMVSSSNGNIILKAGSSIIL
ncbi:MAG: hypothetical protein NTW12_12765, partial [Deltaproteobacteria bacterium]|nr:hypothetical protein [Deltaproteobacteria bacterium]